MPHNAVIEDLQTGEKLFLWAVTSEKLQCTNQISDEPIDLGQISGDQATQEAVIRNALAEDIEFKPLILTVQVDLTGDPGRSSQGPGGAGYDIEQYAKLQDFVNRVTVFAYTSYLFVDSTDYHDFSQPGLRITGLGMGKFTAIKGGGRAVNIIGGKLEFQSIVLNAGEGSELNWDNLWDYGEYNVKAETETVATDQQGNTYYGDIDENGNATGQVHQLAVDYVPRHNVVEVKKLPTLEPVNQQFSLTLEGSTYTFRLRKNLRNGFVTLALYRNGVTPIVEERKVVYGEDMFKGVSDPLLNDYHLVAMDPTGKEAAVTPSNLGKTVHLYLIKEGEGAPIMLASA